MIPERPNLLRQQSVFLYGDMQHEVVRQTSSLTQGLANTVCQFVMLMKSTDLDSMRYTRVVVYISSLSVQFIRVDKLRH